MTRKNASDARLIPSIDDLLKRPAVETLVGRFGRTATVEALRRVTADLRRSLTAEADGAQAPEATGADLVTRIEQRLSGSLERDYAPSLVRVLNATGVVVHTNLGRAPLAQSALDRIREVAAGYSNLEYDLAAGRRGARDLHAERLLIQLTGGEAAVVVNNNAAATLLVLAALAAGREVIVSRGELVEIGGGFRVPDVMAQSGAVLREVGTTNKTRVADYAAAIGERTAAILRVHPSNFRIEGFTERPGLGDLVALADRFRLPLIEDLGSGNFLPEPAAATGQLAEPTVQHVVGTGAHVTCFSGDKLLGGPQAGIIVGRGDLVGVIRRHPLMRALRVDKMTYAALEATLVEYAGGRARETVPVARALGFGPAAIEARARQVVDRLRRTSPLVLALEDGVSTVGGGSAPGSRLPTKLVVLEAPGLSAGELEARLRALHPPVVARIERDRVVLDLRTVLPEEDDVLVDSLSQLTAQDAPPRRGDAP